MPVSSTGEIRGDLTIFGAGDANISARSFPFGLKTARTGPPLAALAEMADQVVSRGVRSVSGDIVGDDTWFVYERYGTGWSWDDLQWGYGAPVSALSVNDNEVYLSAVPAALAGEAAAASFVPATAYYALDNSLISTAAGDAGKPGVERAPGGLTVRLFGRIAIGQPGLHTALAIEDPAEYAARSLREMLVARGVTVTGVARAQHRPPADTTDFFSGQNQPLALHPITVEAVKADVLGQTVLASHVSPPLGQDLVVTNKVSQNLHAEITLRTLGKLEGADGSLVEGTRVVRQFLLSAGVLPGDFVLYDGCGLSVQDLVTPRAFTTLLTFAARQTWGEALRTSLPVGGVDGSLASRFKQPLTDGKVFAKTGYAGRSAGVEWLRGGSQRADSRVFHHVHGPQPIAAVRPDSDGPDCRCDCGVELMSRMVAIALLLLGAAGCRQPLSPSKPDAQLTAQEAAGQRVFVSQCSACHYANTEQGLNGPGLEGLFRKPYLHSGAAANDARVTAVIVYGKGMMPAQGNTISDQELQDLLAYLHTL